MNIVSAVANLQKQLDYYKEISKEQAAIIKQLVEGPGEIEYIHPYDLSVLLNQTDVADVVDIFYTNDQPDVYEFEKFGKKYRQSTHIPAKMKSIV